MTKRKAQFLARLNEAAQSIALGMWIAAVVCMPIALLLRSYAIMLLMVILVAVWQVFAFLVSAIASRGPVRGRTRFRYSPTSWGVLYCVIATLFLLVSVQWGVNLLYLTTAFLFGGIISTGLLPRLTLRSTATEWNLPSHVFAGEPFSIQVTLRNQKRLLSAFGLSVSSRPGRRITSRCGSSCPTEACTGSRRSACAPRSRSA
jgi:hypothetical protein